MKPTSPDQLNNVILHLKNGLSYREIAKKFGIGCTTIHDIAKRNGIERPKNKGDRKSKLNDVFKRNIIRNINTGKCDTALEATKMLQEAKDISVSVQTIRNILKIF